jgi:hypothetical protein
MPRLHLGAATVYTVQNVLPLVSTSVGLWNDPSPLYAYTYLFETIL